MAGLVLKKEHPKDVCYVEIGLCAQYIYIIILVGSSELGGPMWLSPPENVHLLVQMSRWRILYEISEVYDIGMATATPLL